MGSRRRYRRRDVGSAMKSKRGAGVPSRSLCFCSKKQNHTKMDFLIFYTSVPLWIQS